MDLEICHVNVIKWLDVHEVDATSFCGASSLLEVRGGGGNFRMSGLSAKIRNGRHWEVGMIDIDVTIWGEMTSLISSHVLLDVHILNRDRCFLSV